MTLRSLRLVALASVAAVPALLPAQETSGKEDERMEALVKAENQALQWFGPRNKVSIGFRVLNSAGTVHFGNLGSVKARANPPTGTATNVDRVYDNGKISADGPRAEELDEAGNQTSLPGGRYLVYATAEDGSSALTGDYLSYTPGQSRNWIEYTQEQLDKYPGYVGFSNYHTTSEGGSLTDKPGPTGGVELQFSREMGRVSRRVQWGLTGGIALNSINGKSAGSVTSTLNTYTDYYAFAGAVTPRVAVAGALGPTFDDFTSSGGGIYETTVPLNVVPDASKHDETPIPGGATVDGRWQVKGAYLLLKLGPSFRTSFTERLELNGSAGFAGAYAGTVYTATESFKLAGLPDSNQIADPSPVSGNATKFLTGFYADLTLEFAANETTALFGGFTAQKLDAFTQTIPVQNQFARVDLGSAVGIRGGISIKF